MNSGRIKCIQFENIINLIRINIQNKMHHLNTILIVKQSHTKQNKKLIYKIVLISIIYLFFLEVFSNSMLWSS